MKIKKIFAYTCVGFYSLMSVCNAVIGVSHDTGEPPLLEGMTPFEIRVSIGDVSETEGQVREQLFEHVHSKLLALDECERIHNKDISQSKKKEKISKKGFLHSGDILKAIGKYKDFYKELQRMLNENTLRFVYDHLEYTRLIPFFFQNKLFLQESLSILKMIEPYVEPERILAWEKGCVTQQVVDGRLRFQGDTIHNFFRNTANSMEPRFKRMGQEIEEFFQSTSPRDISYSQKEALHNAEAKIQELEKLGQELVSLKKKLEAKTIACNERNGHNYVEPEERVGKVALIAYRYYLKAISNLEKTNHIVKEVENCLKDNKIISLNTQFQPFKTTLEIETKPEGKKKPSSKKRLDSFRHLQEQNEEEFTGESTHTSTSTSTSTTNKNKSELSAPDPQDIPEGIKIIRETRPKQPTLKRLTEERKLRQAQIERNAREFLQDRLKNIPPEKFTVLREDFQNNDLLNAFLYSPRERFNYDHDFENLIKDLGGVIDKRTGSSHFKVYFTDNINATYADPHGKGKEHLTKESMSNILLAMERAGIIRIN